MTIGTAIVANTNVRTTGESGLNHSPSTRLIVVSVGKTQSQIMMASWCLLGGGTRRRSLGGAGVVIGKSPV
jgi:hypothetical protein